MTFATSRERGSLTLELALVIPALMAVIVFIAGAASIQRTRAELDDAAREAVRAASLTRSPADAQAAATATVDDRLRVVRRHCEDRVVDTDLSHFRPGGTVVVEISCAVPLPEAFALFPGRIHVRSRAAEPIDTFRAVG